MPAVELIARRTLEKYPQLDLIVSELIVLLWLYSNPYSTNIRYLASIKDILRRTKEFQDASGFLKVSEQEFTEIVIKILKSLANKKYLRIISIGPIFAKVVLTQKGVNLIEKYMSNAFRSFMDEFGHVP